MLYKPAMGYNTNDFKAHLPSVHRKLHRWYQAHGRRTLPWRNVPDPYAVYVSEIMLQQTQVKTVLERFYAPFLAQFPTIEALAAAPQQAVMKAWEGLGYYTRARNLHMAAKQTGKALPATVEGLLALPGIGRNTAHAVACFGFGVAVPVMEANVKRVLCRVFAMKAVDEKALWEHAGELLDRANPFDYNQAMMDIGAMICTKRAPRCAECPLAGICQGRAAPEEYPAPKARKQTPIRERVIVVYQDKTGKFYVRQRESRFLGGLWGFIEYEHPPHLPSARLIGQVQQVYSHFTLQAQVLLMHATPPEKGGTWATREALSHLPLSKADTKVVALLDADRAR